MHGHKNMASEENLLARWRPVSATTATLTIILILVIIFSFCKYRSKTKRPSNQDALPLPPGPSPWPIIGNLHMLGEFPHRALKDLADKYGPIMFLRFGSVSAVVVSSSKMAKHFLKTHDLLFASRPASEAGKYLAYNFRDVALAPYGEYWRQMKKICVLELLTARRIESFQSVRDEEVSAMIRSIWQESENGTKSVNLSKALSSLTGDIMCRMLMGRKCSVHGPDKLVGMNGLAQLVRQLSALIGAFDIGDFIPCLGYLDLQGIRGRMKKLRREFDALADEIIDEHVERTKKNGQRGNDFVDVLLDICGRGNAMDIKESSKNDIKALLLDMLAAGTDTSAITVEWAMSESFRNPAVKKRVQEELDSAVGNDERVKPSDLPSLEYLHCIVKETLRLHSTVPLLLPHESMEACTVAGYSIPAKTRLIVNAWAIGRDPDVWDEDVLEFKPERFMQGGRHGNIDVRGQDFELIPFGSGRRGCPGTALALEVVSLALAQLLHCFDWNLESNDGVQKQLNMSESYGVTMPRRFQLFAVPILRLHRCL